jgi:hypothetical protein
MLVKAIDPNDQYQHFIMDILLYAKFKLQNGLSIDGIADLLRKTKASIVRLVVCPDFVRALLIQK